MASTVTRSSQRSPVTQVIGYFFLQPVVGATTALTMSDPPVAIGHRTSIRSNIRTMRGAWASVQEASAGSEAVGIAASLFVLSQNKLRAALPSAVAKRQTVVMQGVSPASPTNLGEARKGRLSRQNCKDKTRDIQIGAV